LKTAWALVGEGRFGLRRETKRLSEKQTGSFILVLGFFRDFADENEYRTLFSGSL
jgi:hypothetical protein